MIEKYVINKEMMQTEIIKKSKFIAFSFIVKSQDDAKKIIDEKQREFSDASHVCYAYSLDNGYQKFSDDGEPHGTAGKPMLDCINKQKIVDALVIVVRYFGGTKLGAGNLLRTYVNQTSNILKLSGKVLKDN